MLVEAQVTINGSKAALWAAITNLASAAKILTNQKEIHAKEN